uniref:Ribosomal protein S14 n=1 Tax=Sphaerothecum destruens TaxID=42893 RepID=A0A6H2U2B1_9EUKA|nr:ribosomal protein S14 [Sphaerothecum destruens]QID02706.1 ribosomal protein S14 [Sphaerothecum destruens]
MKIIKELNYKKFKYFFYSTDLSLNYRYNLRLKLESMNNFKRYCNLTKRKRGLCFNSSLNRLTLKSLINKGFTPGISMSKW